MYLAGKPAADNVSMNQKRQPKGIPVGGQFAMNSHDEAGALAVDSGEPSALGATHAHDGSSRPLSEDEFSSLSTGSYEEYISAYRTNLVARYEGDAQASREIIMAAVESGLMRPNRWSGSGDERAPVEYETGDIYIGRTKDGGRMFVQYRAQFGQNAHGSVEDPEVKVNPVRFSMTGSYIPKGDRIVRGGGQNDRELLNVVASKDTPYSEDEARELHALWNRNHLNDMNAGTTEQKKIVDSMTAEERGNALEAYDNTKKRLAEEGLLEDRGYQYGTQWLARSVNADDVQRTLDILSKGEKKVLR